MHPANIYWAPSVGPSTILGGNLTGEQNKKKPGPSWSLLSKKQVKQ